MTKRINTARKGTDIEREAIQKLHDRGYRVHRTIRTRYRTKTGWGSHSNDVFGCIDLVAKRLDERTRWIQVTATRHIGRKKLELDTVPWAIPHDSVEIWRWVPAGRYFQVYRADHGYKLQRHDRVQ